MVFVPAILWSSQVWLANQTLGSWRFSHLFPLNPALIGTGIYAGYYVALHKPLGVMAVPWLFGLLYAANKFHTIDLPFHLTSNQAAGIVHVASWIFQILGHKVFEGRAPAFTKDPIQALVLAPFFVFCEFVFSFGLFKSLSKTLNQDIQAKAAEFRKKKKQ